MQVPGVQLLQRKIQGVERELVEELLQQYEPVWQEFYYRIQPHPLFTRLRLKLSQGEERGVFFDVLPEGSGQPKRANMIFSGGQSAGLMVVLFLTLHLHQNWTRLETVMLDDPLQNLDDINVLGLVDLLRFFAEHRQLILSTHDDRFAGMLLHKFRSLEPNRPIVRYAFEGLTRMGPVIRREESTPTRAAREAMWPTSRVRRPAPRWCSTFRATASARAPSASPLFSTAARLRSPQWSLWRCGFAAVNDAEGGGGGWTAVPARTV